MAAQAGAEQLRFLQARQLWSQSLVAGGGVVLLQTWRAVTREHRGGQGKAGATGLEARLRPWALVAHRQLLVPVVLSAVALDTHKVPPASHTLARPVQSILAAMVATAATLQRFPLSLAGRAGVTVVLEEEESLGF